MLYQTYQLEDDLIERMRVRLGPHHVRRDPVEGQERIVAAKARPLHRAGQHVQLRVAAYPETAFPGTVSLVGDMVNPKTRRITNVPRLCKFNLLPPSTMIFVRQAYYRAITLREHQIQNAIVVELSHGDSADLRRV